LEASCSLGNVYCTQSVWPRSLCHVKALIGLKNAAPRAPRPPRVPRPVSPRFMGTCPSLSASRLAALGGPDALLCWGRVGDRPPVEYLIVWPLAVDSRAAKTSRATVQLASPAVLYWIATFPSTPPAEMYSVSYVSLTRLTLVMPRAPYEMAN